MGKYQYLNLEQKMAKIRKKMPSLLKRFHNDEADYDFATLDDIYESMTPALNKYGVNFDIVKETPTQYDSEGKPVYLTLDKDDFWRYESDMELCWTNIDNPKEERRVVIHVIGTNEIPDKAHGTAMTYGLKYYFRNKFCMRQLGSVTDDPDGMEYNTEKPDAETDGESLSGEGKGKDLKLVKSDSKKQAGKTAQAERNAVNQKAEEIPKDHGFRQEQEVQKAEEKRSSTDAQKRKEKWQQEKTEKASVGKEDTGSSKQQPAGKLEIAGKQAGQKEPEKQQAKASSQSEETGDGFQPAKEEEIPFEDTSFMEELEQQMEEETKDSHSDLEAAKNYVCTFGIYKEKTLGEIMNSGIKGREAVKWIANRYKGDPEMVKAAKLLLENQDLVTMQQAA